MTFKNARKLVETVEEVPVTRIVLETDCPYMAPEPHRGTRNDSRNIRYVAEKIAQIKGITAQEVIDITNENAKSYFLKQNGDCMAFENVKHLGNPTNTIEILDKYGFSFQKIRAEFFLLMKNVVRKIVREAGVTKVDFVLEIGPGIGTMTQILCEEAREVVAGRD